MSIISGLTAVIPRLMSVIPKLVIVNSTHIMSLNEIQEVIEINFNFAQFIIIHG